VLKIDATGALSEAEIDSLDEHGYVVLEIVLTDAECGRVADELDRAWYEHRLDLTSDSEHGVRFVDNALAYSATFESILLEPRVPEAAARVVGDRVVLNLINRRSPAFRAGAAGPSTRARPSGGSTTSRCSTEPPRVLPGSHLNDSEALRRMGTRWMPTLTRSSSRGPRAPSLPQLAPHPRRAPQPE